MPQYMSNPMIVRPGKRVPMAYQIFILRAHFFSMDVSLALIPISTRVKIQEDRCGRVGFSKL